MDAKSFALAFSLLAVSGLSLAAKPVKPPSEQLRHERNQIAVVTVQSVAKQAVTVEQQQSLMGDAFSTITLHFDPAAKPELVKGQQAIVVFSRFQKDPMLRDVWVEREKGPTIVDFPEVPAAWFPVSDSLKLLLSGPNKAVGPEKRVDAALDLAQSNDTANQYFGALELFLDEQLQAALTPEHSKRLAAIVANPKTSEHHKELLMRVAASLPVDDSAWLLPTARQQLTELGVTYDLASRKPALALVSARLIKERGNADDIELLASLLHSNAPAVARAALAGLARIAPEQAKAKAEAALAKGNIAADTRLSLQQYLKTGKLPG